MTISRADLATATVINTLLTAVQNALTYCTTNSFGSGSIIIQVKPPTGSGVVLDARQMDITVNLTMIQTRDILTAFATDQTAALEALGIII